MARFVFHIAIRVRYNYAGYKRTKKEEILPYKGLVPYSALHFVNYVINEYCKMVRLNFDVVKRVFVKKWTGARLLEAEKPLFDALLAKYKELKQAALDQEKAKLKQEQEALKAKKKAARAKREAKILRNAQRRNQKEIAEPEVIDDDVELEVFDDEQQQESDGERAENAKMARKNGGKKSRLIIESPTAQLHVKKANVRESSEAASTSSSNDERNQPTPKHPGDVRKANPNMPTPTSSEKKRRKLVARRIMYSPGASRQGLIHGNLAEELEQDLPNCSLLDGFDIDDIFSR